MRLATASGDFMAVATNITALLTDPVPACQDFGQMVPLLFCLAAGWHILYHPMMLVLRDYWVKRASFWKGAQVQQAALMANFGARTRAAVLHCSLPPHAAVAARRN